MHPRREFLPHHPRDLETFVVLHKALCHVHTETVSSLVKPECHYVSKLLPDCPRARRIHRLFPRMGRIRIGKAVIEGRLGLVVVFVVVLRPWGILLHELADGTGLRIGLAVSFSDVFLVLGADLVGPDVVVAVALVGIGLH